MADEQTPDSGVVAALSDLGQAIVDALLDPRNAEKVKRLHLDINLEAMKDITELGAGAVGKGIGWLASVGLGALRLAEPAFDEIGKASLDAVFGSGGGRGKRKGATDNIGRHLIDSMTGAGAPLEPGTERATEYLSTVLGQQIEAWLFGLGMESISEYMPLAHGGVETFEKLQDIVINFYGGTRVMRRVLGPFLDVGLITPARWAMNKQYRPELLSAGAAIEAHIRGDWPYAQLVEELARQGWSSERIDVQVANARRKLAFDDLAFQHFRGVLSDADVALQAKALGYDESTAATLLAIADLKRIDALNAPVITEAVAGYVSGDLDAAEMERWVSGAAPNATDASRLVATAHARRGIRRQRITSTHMRALVLDGIASVHDYTAALEREGYPPLDVTLLELSLRKEQQADHDLEQAKAEKKRADEQRARDAAAEKARRETEIEAARARTFPALAEYRRAYVRGFVDRQAYADALVREKLGDDDVQFLLEGADFDREQYLQDQATAEQKKADHVATGLSVATLEQAVLKGILTIGEFDSTLAKEGIPDDDRRLLVQLLQAKLEDQAAADEKRADADARAALRSTSLQEWERAVRLGVRSRSEYAAFLQALGLPEPARALILDVLDVQLEADDQAKATRAEKQSVTAPAGLSLAQRRRAVVAGVRPRAFYEQALLAAGWSVDDQLAELDLVDVEIEARVAAEEKRATIVEKVTPSIVSVSALERALSLGLITPAEFAAALRARGASADDADLLVRIAVAKIPDTRAAQRLHETVDVELAEKSVSLGDLERAVLRGLVTLDAYAADLQDRGYGEDAVALLRQLLDDKLGLDVDGLETKIAAALAKVDGAPTLEALVTAFDGGALTPAELQARLVAFGAPRDAALVYVRLLTSV